MDERLFHDALGRIRWSTDRDDLSAAMQTTLGLLLRRPGDQALLNSLLYQARLIVARHADVRQAAIRCVLLLQTAKRGRLTRSQQIKADRRRQRLRYAAWTGAAALLASGAIALLPRF